MDDYRRAWLEGYQAFYQGRWRNQCPYGWRPEDCLHLAWECGWRAANTCPAKKRGIGP